MVRNWTLKNENEMKFLEEFKKWNLIKISNYDYIFLDKKEWRISIDKMLNKFSININPIFMFIKSEDI